MKADRHLVSRMSVQNYMVILVESYIILELYIC